jgi:hypothetical protein
VSFFIIPIHTGLPSQLRVGNGEGPLSRAVHPHLCSPEVQDLIDDKQLTRELLLIWWVWYGRVCLAHGNELLEGPLPPPDLDLESVALMPDLCIPVVLRFVSSQIH